MKKTGLIILAAMALGACNDRNAPDVSDIRVNLELRRFEQELFKTDTLNMGTSMYNLNTKYPAFTSDFVINILGILPAPDSSASTLLSVRRFIHDYAPIRDSADKLFRNFEPYHAQVKKGLQYVKYYFPAYKLPQKLTTFIGPMDAFYEASLGSYGDVITSDGLAVGLQLHLGKDFSVYKSQMGQALYPDYLTRRFAPEYIPVNCMKNVIDDLYPAPAGSKTLVEQMVERGKRLYLLEKFLPQTPDSLLIGYTDKQLKGCNENAGKIWNFFLTNSLLYSNDPGLIKEYISDGPKTPSLGDGSPGNISLFVGREIVRKYMSKNPDTTLEVLLRTDARKIFELSKYKPG